MKIWSKERLAVEPEEEMFRYFACVGERAGRPVASGDFYDRIVTAPAFAPNALFRFRFERDGVETGISEAIERAERGALPRNWIVGPSMRPADLPRHLEENGFELVVPWSGMVLELDKLSAEPDQEGIEVREVEDEAMLLSFTEVVTLHLFHGQAENVPAQRDLFRILLDEPRLKFFAALSGGEVVATATLFLDCGIGGIHGVATRPEHRGRGLGRAVTLATLLESRRAGAEAAVLQASPQGESVYRKLGFEETCRMAVYRYAGGGDAAGR